MSKPIIFDGYEHREMTETEFAEWCELGEEVAARQAEADAKAATRAAALAKLGLTDAEIAALFG